VLVACLPRLRREARRGKPARVCTTRLLQALTYVYVQRRALRDDIEVSAALRALESAANHSSVRQGLREATRLARSGERWTRAAAAAARAGYRHGVCWDVGKPGAGEK